MLKKEKKASKPKKKTADWRHSWAEAVERGSIFEGREVIIARIYKKGLCPTCKDGQLLTPLKWKILTKNGRKWIVKEEHPLNCNVELVFGKYGKPLEFVASAGSYEDKDTIEPELVW